jgi:hypothetical protein
MLDRSNRSGRSLKDQLLQVSQEGFGLHHTYIYELELEIN